MHRKFALNNHLFAKLFTLVCLTSVFLLPTGCSRNSSDDSTDANVSNNEQSDPAPSEAQKKKETQLTEVDTQPKNSPPQQVKQPKSSPPQQADQSKIRQMEQQLIKAWQNKNPGRKPTEPLLKLPVTKGGIRRLAFSPTNPKLVAISGFEKRAELLDLTTGKGMTLEVEAGRPSGLAFTPDGNLLVVTAGKQILIWDPKTNKVQRTIPLERSCSGRSPLVVTNDGKSVIVGSDGVLFGKNDGQTLWQWDIATGKQIRTFPTGNSSLRVVAVSGDDVWVAAGVESSRNPKKPRRLLVWNARNKSDAKEFLADAYIHSMAFSPDSKTLAVGYNLNDKNAVSLVDLKAGTIRTFGKEHDGGVFAMTFIDNKHLLVGYSTAQTSPYRIWDVQSGTVKGKFNKFVNMERLSSLNIKVDESKLYQFDKVIQADR